MTNLLILKQERIERAEQQIENKRNEIDYDTREFTIEIIVTKYLEQDDDDLSEIYVPEYQREFVWDNYRQSRFVESIILGLPVPLLFVAEIKETGRLEIVDGSQRIRTLAAFIQNKLKLSQLKTLDSLNDFYFQDLALSRQRKFKNTPIRMIVLSDKANEDVRNDMFDRINTSSLDLTPMETRKGLYRGDFIDFIFECSQSKKLIDMCPIYKHFQNRYEEAELVLRFLAFSETYPEFCFDNGQGSVDLNRTGVTRFLDEYVLWKNRDFSEKEKQQKSLIFEDILDFVSKNFPSGFKKKKDSRAISRPYFESISVGSYLALKEKPNLIVKDLWSPSDINNETSLFRIPINRYLTHKPENIIRRTDFVKNKLLEYSV